MNELKLEPSIQAEITDIAKSYGFTKIIFDTQLPWEGFRRKLANSRTPADITYRYLFLDPVIQFYSINRILFQKTTKILTIHERTHHLPPFNSNPDVDDYLVQRQACEEYGNPLEMMFLDVLTCQFPRVPYLDDSEISSEVSQHIEKYFWIDQNEKIQALEQLSTRKNYRPKNLRRVLRDERIIPEAKPLLHCLFRLS